MAQLGDRLSGRVARGARLGLVGAALSAGSPGICPRFPVLVGGEQLTFQAEPPAPEGQPWQWSVVEPDLGWVEPESGRYTAPRVSEPRRAHVRAARPGQLATTTVTILPREPFEGPVAWPFCIPGTTRRFGEGFLVQSWCPDCCRTGGQRLVVSYDQPVTLTWPPLPGAERELLSWREGDAFHCREVTGQGSATFRPRAPVSKCTLERLAPGPGERRWRSCLQVFGVKVRGLLPFAGEPGAQGCTDDRGQAARLREPMGLAMLGGALHDPARYVVADAASHTVRRLTPDGEVEGGWGRDLEPGHRDGAPEVARFRRPTFLTVDRWFSVPAPWQVPDAFLVSDTGNHVLRRVDAQGRVTTLAGGPGQAGMRDAARPLEARFHHPQGLAMDRDGTIYIADQGNQVIRKLARSGAVSTLAGSPGVPGSRDGCGPEARFDHLRGLALAWDGNLYVADGHTLRRVSPEGQVTTVLGLAGQPGYRDRPEAGDPPLNGVPCLHDPCGLSSAGDELLIADPGNHAVRSWHLRTGTLTTLAGDPACGLTRFGRLREARRDVFDDACGALARPRAVIRCEGGDLLATTDACVVNLVRD